MGEPIEMGTRAHRDAERRAFRPREIARSLGMSPTAIYTEIYSGRLPARRVGKNEKALIVRSEDLDAWLSERPSVA